MEYIEKLNEMFEELVPAEGPAETKAGEIVRAVSRIGYRFFNDGDKIGVEYGNETCNAAARYLMLEYKDLSQTICGMWGLVSDEMYEKGLNLLVEKSVELIESHPELKEEENNEDYEDSYYDPDDARWESEEEEEVYEPFAVYDPE